MSEAIIVDDLSKQYRLGQTHGDRMLRETMTRVFSPAQWREAREKKSIWALRDVNFAVDEGEVVGIIGRNGAGKSTLLKVLSKITHPTRGKITVQGRVASLLEVGTGFHEELTGRENVFLNGSILGMKKREIVERMESIVEFAGVGKFIDTPIKRYSSGMRLRLGFAVAAHLDPDLLLVDEVLAVGDAEFQKKCLNRMSDIQKSGRTVLFVSHNMAAVENLCPRTIWIDGGQVRADGETHKVIESYMATFGSGTSGYIDWDNLEQREGNGVARFTGLEFLNADGEIVNVIHSGDRVVVRLHYEARERIPAPVFGFKISTDLGTLVTNVNTFGTGFEIPHLPPGAGHIDLEIDFLNLMPARYYLSLWLSSPGPVVYDRIRNCTFVDIEASDFYGSGKGLDSRLGIMFVPCSWSLHTGEQGKARATELPGTAR